MRLAITVIAGIMLATAVSSLQAQTKPAPAPAPKPAAKQAAAPPAAQVAAAAPQASKPAPKPAPKAAAKPAAAPAAKPAGSGAPAESETKVARRDPFESLTSRQEAAARAGANLPPGKAGLQVGTLRLDGIVRAPNGMIAVVTNPQARTYFLREGDQLYDGRVEKIAMDGVSFHEIGKDAFGKPVERQVNKRIYSSAGEQQ
jgi:Tfp pilus assembly protein PilP